MPESFDNLQNLLSKSSPLSVPPPEPQIFEYVPDAQFQYWLQRLARNMIVCLWSGIGLVVFCTNFPQFQIALYSFFRWILIPVKPLLVATPAAEIVGLFSVLTIVCQIFNFLIVPCVVYLAIRAAKPSARLCFFEDRLLIVQPRPWSSSSPIPESFRVVMSGKDYRILKSIPLSTIKTISVERRQGTKSIKDYQIRIDREKGSSVYIRWGDIVKQQDRDSFLELLQTKFPRELDATVFEPFRRIPERQSYTELWLKELSGAPKRDKLTPLAEGSELENGNYVVIKRVGVGGQGTVYLADSNKHATDKHKLVVLKEFVLPVFPDVRVRKKAAERFQAEAAMLSRLDHPQIARFVDLFIEDHRAYLVLEHVDGDTLKDIVAAQGPLPEPEVVRLATQVCEILAYLHTREPAVLHRDLTPDNIMLDQDGLAKLIDFSVAEDMSSRVTGSVVGKPNYISPEQFRGKPTTGSDIYSLGATMFYLLIGHDPPPITVLHPQLENSKISNELDTIVARCTQLDANKRYEKAEHVLEDLKLLA